MTHQRRWWLVARHEFISNITKPSFLFATFGIPLFIVVVMVIVAWITASTIDSGEVEGERLGLYQAVDLLPAELLARENIRSYKDWESAQTALDDGTLDALIQIGPNYYADGKVGLYSYGTVAEDLQERVEELIAEALMIQVGEARYADRLLNPARMSIYVEDTGRTLTRDNVFGLFILPMAFVVLFMLTLQLTSQFLMAGVVEEKTNRLMEILVTTVKPLDLLAGKVLGLGAIGLVQVVVWLAIGLVALRLGGDLPFLEAVALPLDLLLVVLAYFVLTYFLLGSLLAGFGAIVDSEQESRSYAGIVTLPLVLPLFFIFNFFSDANGPLPTLLSLIPVTSGMAMIFRMSFVAVPLWQVLLSLGLLLLTTLLVLVIAARLFRWGILLYGKSPTPREIWRVIRSGQTQRQTQEVRA
ncbi:MAG: ABC transporter permease [Anaerolineae bacterium]|nr:ABC transporter permease [Anaerolineae bacterium]MDW8171155.1 ABC transporter permease [Anaerolineae bacterium]